MRLRDLTIGQRLALGFGAVLLLLLGLGGVYFTGQQRLDEVTGRLTSEIMPKAEAANDLETAYLRLSAAAHSYVYSGDVHYLAEYNTSDALAHDALSRLEGLPRAAEGEALLSQIEPLATQYTQAAQRAIALREQGASAEAQQVVEREMIPLRSQLLEKAQAFVGLQMQQRDQAKAEVGQVSTDTARTYVGIALLAGALVVLTSVLTVQSIRGQARTLVSASQSLAGGDFGSAISLASTVAGTKGNQVPRNEMHVLAAAFGSMGEALLEREKRLKSQANLSSVLASSIELQQLANDALRQIVEHLGVEFGAVYVCESETDLLRRVGAFALDSAPETIGIGEGIPGQAAASREKILVCDIPSDTPFRVHFGFDEVPPRTILAMPMVAGDRIAGVILLGCLRDLTDESIDFVEVSARQLAISLQNALAHRQVQDLAGVLQEKNELLAAQNEELQAQQEELQAQNEELQAQQDELQAQNEKLQTQSEEIEAQSAELIEQNYWLDRQARRIAALQDITVHLGESLTSETVLDKVVQAAGDLLGSATAAVMLLDESRDFFTVAAASGLDEEARLGLRLDRRASLAGRVIAEGRAIFISDVSSALEVRLPHLISREPVGSLIGAPLMVSGEPAGVIEVYFDTQHDFNQDEADLLSALAAAASVALQDARLFEAIDQQRRLLESVLASIPEAVYVTDGDGSVVIANLAARNMLGICEAQSVRIPAEESVAPLSAATSPEVRQVTAKALDGEELLAVEVPFENPATNSQGYAQVSAVPVVEGGRVASVVTIAADISRLKELDRLKDEFLSEAAHELKSPITSLKGFAQLLQKQLRGKSASEEAREKMLQSIDRQAQKVAELVDRLLDMSRVQMGRLAVNKEPTDLAEIVHQQVQQAEVRSAKHRLVTDVESEVIGFLDKGYIGQVIGNLLDNAMRYSPEGGEVRISLRRDGPVARLFISDQGIGMSAEDLANVFKRHYRSAEAKKLSLDGMGIGLYVSHEIVTAHGGRIWAESKPGQGSVFKVELPLDRSG